MAKKKKLSKEERKRIRLQKGWQCLVTCQRTPKDLLKHYKERFHVDGLTAARNGSYCFDNFHSFFCGEEGYF